MFAAPANTRLAANTTYFLVVYTVGDFDLRLDATQSNSEDKPLSRTRLEHRGQRPSHQLPGVGVPGTSWNSQALYQLHIAVKGKQVVTPATVSLSASPAQVWEGASLPLQVVATLSRAQSFDLRIPVEASPCPTGSWCNSLDSSKNRTILIPAGSTTGVLQLKGPRDADADHEEATVSLKSSLPDGIRAGRKTSQKITVLDPDGFAMTITADRQPAEGGGVVKVTVDLGQPAPDGFYAKINSSASTAKFGYVWARGTRLTGRWTGRWESRSRTLPPAPCSPGPRPRSGGHVSCPA